MIAKKKSKLVKTKQISVITDQDIASKKAGLINILTQYLDTDKFNWTITKPKDFVITDNEMLKDSNTNIKIAKKFAKTILEEITVVKRMLDDLKDVPLSKEKQIEKSRDEVIEFYENAEQEYKAKIKVEQDRLNLAIQTINTYKIAILNLFQSLIVGKENLEKKTSLINQKILLLSTTVSEDQQDLQKEILEDIDSELEKEPISVIPEVKEDTTNYSKSRLIQEKITDYTILEKDMNRAVQFFLMNGLESVLNITLKKREFNTWVKSKKENADLPFITVDTELK